MTEHHTTADYPYRVRLLVLRMLVLSVAVCAVFLLFTSAGAGSPPAPTVKHVVMSGENLWMLAESVAEEGDDIRRVVRVIQEINGLEDADIRPGEVLELPAR